MIRFKVYKEEEDKEEVDREVILRLVANNNGRSMKVMACDEKGNFLYCGAVCEITEKGIHFFPNLNEDVPIAKDADGKAVLVKLPL